MNAKAQQARLAARIRIVVPQLVNALMAAGARRPRRQSVAQIRRAMQTIEITPALQQQFDAVASLCWRLALTGRPWVIGWTNKRRPVIERLGLTVDDVAAEMLTGLFIAAWTYDPKQKAAFLTYGNPSARVRAQRAMMAATPVYVPVYAAAQTITINALRNEGLSDAEVEKRLNLRSGRLAELAYPQASPLDAPVREDGGLRHEIFKSSDPEAELIEADLEMRKRALVRKAMAALVDHRDPRLHGIVTRRFGLDGAGEGNHRTIGRGLGISHARVQTLEQDALRVIAAQPGVADIAAAELRGERRSHRVLP